MFPSGVCISRRFERTAPGCRVGSAGWWCVLRRHLRALARDLWDVAGLVGCAPEAYLPADRPLLP